MERQWFTANPTDPRQALQRARYFRATREVLRARAEHQEVLTRLAGGVSHELRTPLSAIANVVYFLESALTPTPDVKAALTLLRSELSTCERIVAALVDFGRGERPSRQPVDVNEVVRRSLSHVRVPEGVLVSVRLDEAVSTTLADADQLERVFVNLLLNALQAMDGGGRLTVTTGPSPRGELEISFTDTGVGLEKAEQARIFEPFCTTRSGGLGMGLALARSLVTGHGGELMVKSAKGKGSTFTVTLPAQTPRSAAGRRLAGAR